MLLAAVHRWKSNEQSPTKQTLCVPLFGYKLYMADFVKKIPSLIGLPVFKRCLIHTCNFTLLVVLSQVHRETENVYIYKFSFS